MTQNLLDKLNRYKTELEDYKKVDFDSFDFYNNIDSVETQKLLENFKDLIFSKIYSYIKDTGVLNAIYSIRASSDKSSEVNNIRNDLIKIIQDLHELLDHKVVTSIETAYLEKYSDKKYYPKAYENISDAILDKPISKDQQGIAFNEFINRINDINNFNHIDSINNIDSLKSLIEKLAPIQTICHIEDFIKQNSNVISDYTKYSILKSSYVQKFNELIKIKDKVISGEYKLYPNSFTIFDNYCLFCLNKLSNPDDCEKNLEYLNSNNFMGECKTFYSAIIPYALKVIDVLSEEIKLVKSTKPKPEGLTEKVQNYTFRKITNGRLKNKIAVCYKGIEKGELQSNRRKEVFEYLLSRNNEIGIRSTDIIKKCNIKAKDPFNTLKTYIGELNTLLREIHNKSDKTFLYITIINKNINPNIPL